MSDTQDRSDHNNTPWETLITAGVVDSRYQPTPTFRSDWERLLTRVRGADRTAYVAMMLETNQANVTVETGDPVIVMDGTWIAGEWPSIAALDADAALWTALQQWLPKWETIPSAEQRTLIIHLRTLMDGRTEAQQR